MMYHEFVERNCWGPIINVVNFTPLEKHFIHLLVFVGIDVNLWLAGGLISLINLIDNTRWLRLRWLLHWQGNSQWEQCVKLLRLVALPLHPQSGALLCPPWWHCSASQRASSAISVDVTNTTTLCDLWQVLVENGVPFLAVPVSRLCWRLNLLKRYIYQYVFVFVSLVLRELNNPVFQTTQNKSISANRGISQTGFDVKEFGYILLFIQQLHDLHTWNMVRNGNKQAFQQYQIQPSWKCDTSNINKKKKKRAYADFAE